MPKKVTLPNRRTFYVRYDKKDKEKLFLNMLRLGEEYIN